MTATRVDVGGRHLTLTNLDKVLYPAAGFTKAQVVDYYARIGEWMLPHLGGRALTLVRCPDGVDGERFFEKRCPPHHPDWVPAVGELRSCEARELATLVWLANLAALELHTLQARATRPDRPTAMVLDLDPGPPATILDCCRVALDLRALLEELGLAAVVKTSGSKGLHLSVPLNVDDRGLTADATKGFALELGRALASRFPDRVVTDMRKNLRPDRVFVDWSQNDEHKTTVCAYSLRIGPRPTVSTPVSWDEVDDALTGGDPDVLVFEAADTLSRATDLGDLYSPNVTLEQHLPRLG